MLMCYFMMANTLVSNTVKKVGWGHCSIQDAIDFATLTKVKKMVLFHHDPNNTDLELQQMYSDEITNKEYDFELVMGKENDVLMI